MGTSNFVGSYIKISKFRYFPRLSCYAVTIAVTDSGRIKYTVKRMKLTAVLDVSARDIDRTSASMRSRKRLNSHLGKTNSSPQTFITTAKCPVHKHKILPKRRNGAVTSRRSSSRNAPYHNSTKINTYTTPNALYSVGIAAPRSRTRVVFAHSSSRMAPGAAPVLELSCAVHRTPSFIRTRCGES